MEKDTNNVSWEQDICTQQNIISRFVSDRMSYIVLGGCWCNIIVLIVHAPSEKGNNDSKDSFYEELERVF